jgi:16S rRNA (adenine1518-N6/adenine1519-N6)-dimethyltransferase
MSHGKHNNFKFKHSLGQNFITDEFLLEDIADESGITKDDYVLEIGPGNGALTRCLCDRAKYVVAVEIDKSLIPLLTSNLKEYKNVSIINADFLNCDFQNILNEFLNVAHIVRDDSVEASNKVGASENVGASSASPLKSDNIHPIKVVANLPYYITSPIIQNLLQNPYISEMTLMVQKEVAERIVATPNTKDFGILTLACNYYADTEMIMIVSKDCFFPRPKVDSAVVHFKKHSIQNNSKSTGELRRIGELSEPCSVCTGELCEPQSDNNYEKLFKLIKASFAQRRKKLLNSLTNAGYNKDTLAAAFAKLNFDENVRAENLSLEDYKNLLSLI